MVLRNAFENLAVESKQDTIISELLNIIAELQAAASDADTDAAAAQSRLDLLATEAKLESVRAELSTQQKNALTNTELRATPIPVTFPADESGLTDVELRAADVKVTLDGEQVAVSNFPATQPVSGTVAVSNHPTQQTDALTNTQLRATAVPVSGTVTASGPLTDTQLRASSVLVSGPVTDTQLRATALPVSGTVAVSNFPAQTGLTDTQLRAADVKVTLDSEQVAVSNFPAPPSDYPLPSGQVADLKNVSVITTDQETRMDYDVRTDGNPVYVGVATQGTATLSASWVVLKLTYDGSNRLTRKERISDAIWDNRATLGWT